MSFAGWIYDKTAGAAQRARREAQSKARAKWVLTRSAFHQMRVPISEQARRVKACTLGVKAVVVLLFIITGTLLAPALGGWIVLVFLLVVIVAHWIFDAFNIAGARLAKWIFFGDFQLDPHKDLDAYNLEAELRCMQAAANIEAWRAMDPEVQRKYAPDLLGSLQSLSTTRDFSSTWDEMQTLASQRIGGPTLPMRPKEEAEVVEVEIMPADDSRGSTGLEKDR